MAKFLNTSGTTYHLEELIKKSSDRLILISPYLKLNERIKELLEDKNRLKIDIRIVYGKSDLQPEEINWLKNLTFIRTSFCKNLHAKCYMNENECIITSLNLYEFSQINNNEMGILIARDADNQLYSDAYEEAQRIIRISEEVRMSVDKVNEMSTTSENKEYGKITIAKLASQLGMKTPELSAKMIENGYLQEIAGELRLTQLGSEKGGEEKRGKFGIFTIWHKNFNF
ncbi:MAG: DNA repair protein [Gammaproteobacteria bacterium]|nr:MULTISPECIES: phospholipase D family protein [unclassified Moraxella]NOX78726.1 DNA repair protein [Gammaproteobacteria bacterium]NPA77949.1 DNA repair protein [Gammaproteobacteria bacterium]ONG40645.1 DNA repair protein [Enhydrobacter sp. H5]